jgi:hypothetical protein
MTHIFDRISTRRAAWHRAADREEHLGLGALSVSSRRREDGVRIDLPTPTPDVRA